MSRLEIFICVLSIASVVFLHVNAATSQKQSLSNNPEEKLTEELEEANDEREMNDEGEDAELIEEQYDEKGDNTSSPKEYSYHWIDDEDDDAPINSDLQKANDSRRRRRRRRRCRFFCRRICIRPCRRCRRICRRSCRRVCFGK